MLDCAPLPSSPLANRRPRRRALVSLTPLIDVVFILLVFFMLASSFLDWRVIRLDAPAPATRAGGAEGALLVEVRSDDLRLAGSVLDLAALQAELAKRFAEDPERRVLIRPDAGVSLQRAVAAFDAVSEAGGRNMSLIRKGAP